MVVDKFSDIQYKIEATFFVLTVFDNCETVILNYF